MNEAERAVAAAMTIECKKDGLRQTQDGLWKLSLTVAELPEGLAMAPMGVRYQAVFVELDDVEEPVKRGKPEREPDTEGQRVFKHFNATVQDEGFCNWFATEGPMFYEVDQTTRSAVKIFIRIDSANELLTDPAARERWDQLWTSYKYRDNVR